MDRQMAFSSVCTKSPSASLIRALVIGFRAHLYNQGSSPHNKILSSSPPSCHLHCHRGYKPRAGSPRRWAGRVLRDSAHRFPWNSYMTQATPSPAAREAQWLRVTHSSLRSQRERRGGCAELAAGSWVSVPTTGPQGWFANLNKVFI